jgi:cell wall-associated NlpC family hydrolase
MLKKLIVGSAVVMMLGSCANMKPLAFSNKQAVSTPVNNESNKEIRFLDNVSSGSATTASAEIKETRKESKQNEGKKSSAETVRDQPIIIADRSSENIEKASSLQFKYALLLNTDVEQVQNIPLYQSIDEWYGTRYRMGGTTKKGIDCSAFVQSVFLAAFGAALPRTAREQYKLSQKISSTELQEGDLLFFNTRGGVSHVGIYLQNNKFVHASSSGGVMISNMFDPYYVRHFIAAGRINREASVYIRP